MWELPGSSWVRRHRASSDSDCKPRRRLARRWLFAPLLAAVAVCAIAPTSALALSTITGTVFDNNSDAAVSGVTVSAYDVTGVSPILASNLTSPVTTTTTAGGAYSLTGLNGTHSYVIGFSEPGAYSTQYYIGSGDNSTPNPEESAAVAGTAGSIGQTELAIGAGLSGMVTDADASAASKLDEDEVFAYTAVGQTDGDSAAGEASVNSDGTYYIDGLPVTSDLLVEFIPEDGVKELPLWYGGASGAALATPVATSTGSITPNINQTLVLNAGAISGTVVGLGAGSRAWVVLYNSVGDEIGDADEVTGAFSIGGLSPGTYYAYVFDQSSADDLSPVYYGGSATLAGATGIPVATGQTVSGITVTLTPGGKITGTISGPTGHDLAGTTVYAFSTADPYDEVGNGSVAANGSYTISNLAPGTYHVEWQARNDGNYAEAWYAGTTVAAEQPDATAVTVSAGAVTTANFPIPLPAEIEGRVTAKATGAGVEGVGIEVYDDHGLIVGYSETSADGTYLVGGLLPGTYRVQFLTTSEDEDLGEGATPTLAFQFYNNSATFAGAQTLTLVAGATASGINAALVAGGAISGTVTDADGGAPLDTATVNLLDAKGNIVETTETNPDGTYTLYGVPAGTYYVEFDAATLYSDESEAADSYALEFYGGKATLEGSTAVTVVAGATTKNINAALFSLADIGVPTESKGSLSGLAKRKVALRVEVAAGVFGAPDLASFKVTLPKGFSFDKKTLKKDLSLGKGVQYVYTLKGSSLTISVVKPEVSFTVSIKAGGITDTNAIAKKAKKHKVKSETVKLSAWDALGSMTELNFVVKKPH
jgi:hypothetical protein